ncbi:hypothetical protein C8R46DRAFT_596473 [Mycena filopes]|nr:hypothetical protein C8R46DRAFT_596473 [Mycena filopes]
MERFTSILRGVSRRTCLTTHFTEKMAMSDLSPEVLARIFLHLPYHSLLLVQEVSVQWNAVTKDPALSVQLFKKFTKEYVEPGCPTKRSGWGAYETDVDAIIDNDPKFSEFELTVPDHAPSKVRAAWLESRMKAEGAAKLLANPKWKPRPLPEKTRLHPAVDSVSYLVGNDLNTVCFYVGNDKQLELSDLAIANDFFSIPAVTKATISCGTFTAQVKNGMGIKVIDFFKAMVEESNVKVKRGHKTMTKGDLLGDHRFYEGVINIRRNGLDLVAEIARGS